MRKFCLRSEQFVDGGLFAHEPDDVALLETVGGQNGGEVLLALLKANDHACVATADAALLKSFTEEGTTLGDDHLPQLHLAFLNVGVLADDVMFEGLPQVGELLVATDDLNAVEGIETSFAVWNILAVAATQDAAYVDAIAMPKVEFAQ